MALGVISLNVTRKIFLGSVGGISFLLSTFSLFFSSASGLAFFFFQRGALASCSGYFDGLPWINEISTLARSQGKWVEFVQDRRLPAYAGANAAFLAAPGLKRVREDAYIFDLRQFRGKRVLAGYLFGGIRAFPKEFPYTEEAHEYPSGNVPTKPNSMILKVYVTAH